MDADDIRPSKGETIASEGKKTRKRTERIEEHKARTHKTKHALDSLFSSNRLPMPQTVSCVNIFFIYFPFLPFTLNTFPLGFHRNFFLPKMTCFGAVFFFFNIFCIYHAVKYTQICIHYLFQDTLGFREVRAAKKLLSTV